MVAANEVEPVGRWTRRRTRLNFSSKIILATNEDRAIDLSCRACGAGAWALGLDSRLGASPFFPTSDFGDCVSKTEGSPIGFIPIF